MSRFLVLGNGFDIAHGLPTSYKDFLYVCANAVGFEFDDHYDDNKKNRMKVILDIFVSKYKKCLDKIKNNSWLKYFLSIYKTTGEKWVDFEKEIKKVCEMCSCQKESEWIIPEHEMFEFDSFNGEYDLFKMKSHLIELIDIFNKYLLILPDDCTTKYYEEIFNFEPTGIISFNYTNTYNKIYCENQKIDYIHGKISEQRNTIVLGFDSMNDESDDVKFGEFIKYFQMVEKEVELELESYIEIQQIEPQFQEYNEAMFFGHSLDKTDIDIIKTIIDSVGFVFLYYHNDEHKNQMIKNLIDIYGRNGFKNLTLSKNKKVFFIRQSIGKELSNENRDFVKNYFSSIKEINFETCSTKELIDFVNNPYIKPGYSCLESLLNKLKQQEYKLSKRLDSNYDELKKILEVELEKRKIKDV